jgi:MFS family permease
MPPAPPSSAPVADLPVAGPRLIAGLMVGMALHAFHGTAIITAMPLIAASLEGRSLYGAAISVYLVASIVGLAAAAGPVGRHGPRRVLAAGLLFFSLGIGLSAAAPAMGWLVLGRAVEGIGGGILSTVLFASVNLAFPATARARILALLAAAWVIPMLGAPPLAAGIAEAFGWQWVFLAVLPAVWFTWLCAAGPLSRVGVAPSSDIGAGVPTMEAIALASGCGLLLVAGGFVGASAGRLVSSALLAILGLALILHRFDRVLPPGTLGARPGLPSAIALKTLLAMCFFGVEGFLPLATTELLGWSTLEAGLLLSAAGVAWTLGSIAEARFAGRGDGRGALLGSAIVVAGVAGGIVAMQRLAPMPWLFACWTLAAFGMGIGYNVANSTAMAKTEPGREGLTSSALGISDSLGIAVATGLGGVLLAIGEAFSLPLRSMLGVQLWTMVLIGTIAMAVAVRVYASVLEGSPFQLAPVNPVPPAGGA